MDRSTFKKWSYENPSKASREISAAASRFSEASIEDLRQIISLSSVSYKALFSDLPDQVFIMALLVAMTYTSKDPLSRSPELMLNHDVNVKAICDELGLSYDYAIPISILEEAVLKVVSETCNESF
ncbi:hypothetical protein EQG41_01105 [Billgrantia azerbaijanica]|nr:hypothetical protein EQG41_01105 [Halomonas azerbaijanica]